MRVSEDRYARDLRSIDLARRMLTQEVRTGSIRAWTGLTGDRVRKLARDQGLAERRAVQRHRGPSPNSLLELLKTARARQEAAAAAGLCRVMQVLPEKPIPHAHTTLPGLVRGEQLLAAFEIFRAVAPEARLTLDQLMFLVLTIAEGESWKIDHCTRCHATILMDRLGVSPRRVCGFCGPAEEAELREPSFAYTLPTSDVEPLEPLQHRLFD